jgi:uncharacterized oligopeptide transporter (OPT) family protein
VWIFTARLVTGKGLPPMAQQWALGAAVLFGCFTALRIRLDPRSRWQKMIPGGIAVAVGTLLLSKDDALFCLSGWKKVGGWGLVMVLE